MQQEWKCYSVLFILTRRAVRGDSVLRLQGEMLRVVLPDVSRGNFWCFLFTIECTDPTAGTSKVALSVKWYLQVGRLFGEGSSSCDLQKFHQCWHSAGSSGQEWCGLGLYVEEGGCLCLTSFCWSSSVGFP